VNADDRDTNQEEKLITKEERISKFATSNKKSFEKFIHYPLTIARYSIARLLIFQTAERERVQLFLMSEKTGNDPQQKEQDVKNHERSSKYYAEKGRQKMSAWTRV
jgi:hypothetical protein